MKKGLISSLLWAAFSILITVSCFLFLPPRGPLKFAPDVLPDASAGVPYEVKITISGNATPPFLYSVSQDALPKGLKLEMVAEDHTAHIFGTPQETGTFHFKVLVYCYGTNVPGQQGEHDYSLTVK